MPARALKQARREYERALTAVFELLMNCGVRHNAISPMAVRACRTAMANARPLDAANDGELATLGLVLDAWHRDRRYLTSRGRPKAVPLLGTPPSVEALIRLQGRQLDAVELARRLQSLRLIEPTSHNRYRPTGDAALVSRYGPTVLQYVARCLTALLETVGHNIQSGPSSPPLLERIAEVPTLPIECLESFRQFTGSQGSAFTRIINDWLETRRARGSSARKGKTVRAGVHLYVYVTSDTPRPKRQTAAKRR